ncbi:MAG: AMP-binding protein, partial [Thermodesulfobacteriota bacterium]
MENRDYLLEYSIPQLLRWRVNTSGKATALREKDFGRWIPYSWDDYYDYTRRAGLGLKELGFGKDDKIAIICDNIPEVLFVAIGAQALGGISVGIYQTSLPDEIAGIIDQLDVSVVFCSDQEQVDKVLEVRDRVPAVK